MTSAPEQNPDLIDRVVDLLARAMDAVGWNGSRLRWKWSRKRRDLGESGLRTVVLWRSATARYKMCPSCRMLVARSAASCPECGSGLAAVRAPGLSRLIGNVIPGATSASSLLLLANGALFVLMLMTSISSGRSRGLLSAFDPITLVRFGSGLNVLTIEHGEWWRIVTPIFLHGGLLHFAFNCYALLQLGPLVEEEYGTKRFAVAYLVSGIFGNVFSQYVRPVLADFLPWLGPGVHTVGASGALCGLIGLMLVYGAKRGGAGKSLRSGMTQYALYLLIFSFLPGIDLLCHLGGFVGGLLLGFVVPAGPVRNLRAASLWDGLVWALVLVILLAFSQVAVHGTESVRWLESLRG